jgi:hypothetical protein
MRLMAEHFLIEAREAIDPKAMADALSNLLESLAIRTDANVYTMRAADAPSWRALSDAIRAAADTFETMAEGR